METATPNAAQPRTRRRWYQFRLRTLLIGVTVAGCGFGWLGLKVREARRQQAAVATIEKMGGGIGYDYEYDAQGNYVPDHVPDHVPNPTPPGPAWLRALLGDDFFRSVYKVYLPAWRERHITDADLEQLVGFTKLAMAELDGTQVTDAGLEHLSGLTRLEWLSLDETQVTDAGLEHLRLLTRLKGLSLKGTRVTDAGLEHLKGLTRLDWLGLNKTQVTDAGVAQLQKALPKCKIGWH
jgi:hypothetical protein